MADECLALRLMAGGVVEVQFPGRSTWIASDRQISLSARALFDTLGLAVGACLGDRLVRLLIGLALARAEGCDSVDAAWLARIAWPGRSVRTVENVLADCLLPDTGTRPSLASPWRGADDPRLVQVAQREGRVHRTAAPLRLNPRYPCVPEVDRLLRWLRAGNDEAERAALRGATWERVLEHTAGLTATGAEDQAWRLLAALDDPSDRRALLRRAELGMQVGLSGEAQALAIEAGCRAKDAHDRPAYAESLHVRALTARQQRDLPGSLRAVRDAIRVLRSLPSSPEVSARIWQFRLTQAISAGAAVWTPRPRQPFVPPGGASHAWGVVTRSFAQLEREALDAGRARDAAHAALRGATHALNEWELRDTSLCTLERARASRTELSPAAQVILDRVFASDRYLRTADPEALARLLEVRDQDAARGYRHQVAIIGETIDLARGWHRRRS